MVLFFVKCECGGRFEIQNPNLNELLSGKGFYYNCPLCTRDNLAVFELTVSQNVELEREPYVPYNKVGCDRFIPNKELDERIKRD